MTFVVAEVYDSVSVFAMTSVHRKGETAVAGGASADKRGECRLAVGAGSRRMPRLRTGRRGEDSLADRRVSTAWFPVQASRLPVRLTLRRGGVLLALTASRKSSTLC